MFKETDSLLKITLLPFSEHLLVFNALRLQCQFVFFVESYFHEAFCNTRTVLKKFTLCCVTTIDDVIPQDLNLHGNIHRAERTVLRP